MNKNIDFISLNNSSLKQLIADLKQSGSVQFYEEEILPALENLLSGKVSSVIFENGEGIELISEPTIKCGDLSIFPKARKVTRKNEEIILTPKEFDILYFLAKNRGNVFTKEQIYRAVWEDDYLLDDSNIMAFIRKLRKKIEPNPDNPIYILTIWGIGYKFNENV